MIKTMKKKLLLLIIRLIRLFKSEDKFIPNLRAVPEGKVRHGRLYRYYGRILVARPWEEEVIFRYKVLDKEFGYNGETVYNEVKKLLAK